MTFHSWKSLFTHNKYNKMKWHSAVQVVNISLRHESNIPHSGNSGAVQVLSMAQGSLNHDQCYKPACLWLKNTFSDNETQNKTKQNEISFLRSSLINTTY